MIETKTAPGVAAPGADEVVPMSNFNSIAVMASEVVVLDNPSAEVLASVRESSVDPDKQRNSHENAIARAALAWSPNPFISGDERAKHEHSGSAWKSAATTHTSADSPSKRPPWVAFYASDFLASVMELGNTEVGIYIRLMASYYVRPGPLPADRGALTRIAQAFAPEELKALDAVLDRYFVEDPDGRYRHSRCDRELMEAYDRWFKASKKGKAGAIARWTKYKEAKGNSTEAGELEPF